MQDKGKGTNKLAKTTPRWLSLPSPAQQRHAYCDNIFSGYLSVVTTVFSQQDGIYGFKFPKRFLEISSRDLTLFFLLSILII